MSARKHFFNSLTTLPGKERFTIFMRYRLSAVIVSAKPAELVSMCNAGYNLYRLWKLYGPELLKILGLEYVMLKESNSCACVFIFKRHCLSHSIQGKNCRLLLQRCGYDNTLDVDQILSNLQTRFTTSCPHEIGLLLGIPLDDVQGFIANQGRNYLFSSYWKVYSNPQHAKKIFRVYDSAKKTVIENYLRTVTYKNKLGAY